ncbi:uncharacterized protein LOC135092803 isoform X2 [Scylla paramamosain]|uniref:uncharacterized protein LOC135092803 isoform X2 n=1 Tax=Scylla paramamosain TaxID=85552 RepID=UPI003082942F
MRKGRNQQQKIKSKETEEDRHKLRLTSIFISLLRDPSISALPSSPAHLNPDTRGHYIQGGTHTRGREGGENCHTSQGRRVNEMRTQAGPNNPPCGRTDSTNNTTIKNTKDAAENNPYSRTDSTNTTTIKYTKDAAQYNPYSKTAKTGKKLIPDNKKTKNTQLELEDPPDTTGRTSPARRTQKHTTMQDKTDTDSTDSTDKSILSFTSSIPSARLVEGPQGTEVEAWTVPVEEGHGVLLTTALATTATSCVLLVVQECGLGLWRPSAGGWTLVGETQHSIRNIGDIRDIRVEGLPSGEEGRFLMVAQREGEEQVEVMYIQVSLCGKDWQLSSASLKSPVSVSSGLALCVVGEWSVVISWAPQDTSDNPHLILLDLDLTYSRRAKKWELVCRPSTCSLPAGGGGGGGGITALLSECGTSGVVVCWSAEALTLFDPWQDAVIGCLPSPVTRVLWALAVQELLFVVGPRPGEPDLSLTAINPMTGSCDPFLTFSLSKGTTGVPPAALVEGGSLWRLTGVCLQLDRLTLSFSGGHGVCVYFRGRAEPRDHPCLSPPALPCTCPVPVTSTTKRTPQRHSQPGALPRSVAWSKNMETYNGPCLPCYPDLLIVS